MKVKFSERSIEVTKTFAEKAARFGSEEYNLLRTAMQDLPDFKLVIKATPKRHQTYMKGLTYEYMYSYISDVNKDDSLMEEYMKLREYGCNYGQIRKWFLTRFTEFNNFAA